MTNELEESYDPVKEFYELLKNFGQHVPPTDEEIRWRKAMYCRYRCRFVNWDQDAPQNTWAEVARFIGRPKWQELRSYCTIKFLQLAKVNDAGARDIFDVPLRPPLPHDEAIGNFGQTVKGNLPLTREVTASGMDP